MKRLVILACAVMLCMLLLPKTQALDYSESFGVEEAESAAPKSASEILNGWNNTQSAESGLEKIASAALEKLDEIIAEVLSPVCAVLAIVLLCSAVGSMELTPGQIGYVELGGCLAAAGIYAGDISGLVAMSGQVMSELSDFSKALLPTLSAAAVAAGATGSAPVKYAATALFMDILMSLSQKLIFPLICAYVAAAAADSALGDGRLKGIVRLMRSICKIMLTAFVTVFTLYLSITGVVASSTDVLATKAAKTAISAALPIVGGIISDAAGSIVAGAGVVRGAVGVFGLLAVLAACIVPFLKLGVRYLLLKAAAALSSVVAGGRISGLLDSLADACAMLLGAVGAQVLFLYISIISLVKAVGG